ncbi:hypothetical protein B0H17DRAFT_1184806 [Mycena rosella]|uniref:Uncharacterized protein n=1 Tax=Mycena rosella TaxID=1033263 RepID=A0AAD7CU45_MYCRO|nr:hypothetical protein B0H17DRAFT_1184806 [Mycena rosella]
MMQEETDPRDDAGWNAKAEDIYNGALLGGDSQFKLYEQGPRTAIQLRDLREARHPQSVMARSGFFFHIAMVTVVARRLSAGNALGSTTRSHKTSRRHVNGHRGRVCPDRWMDDPADGNTGEHVYGTARIVFVRSHHRWRGTRARWPRGSRRLRTPFNRLLRVQFGTKLRCFAIGTTLEPQHDDNQPLLFSAKWQIGDFGVTEWQRRRRAIENAIEVDERTSKHISASQTCGNLKAELPSTPIAAPREPARGSSISILALRELIDVHRNDGSS